MSVLVRPGFAQAFRVTFAVPPLKPGGITASSSLNALPLPFTVADLPFFVAMIEYEKSSVALTTTAGLPLGDTPFFAFAPATVVECRQFVAPLGQPEPIALLIAADDVRGDPSTSIMPLWKSARFAESRK